MRLPLQRAVLEAAARNPGFLDHLIPLSYVFGLPIGEPRAAADLLRPTFELADGAEVAEVTPGFWAPLGESDKLLWMPAADPAVCVPMPVRRGERPPQLPLSVWSDVLTMHAELRFWPSAHRELTGTWRCRWVAREHAPVPPTAAERRHLEALRGRGQSLEAALRQLTHCGVAE